jgi:hypothetical protein
MNYLYFPLDALMPAADCPDRTSRGTFDGLKKIIRVISTSNSFGVVIDGIYLSLASGKDTFKRGDYALLRDLNNKIWLGVNENLY